jgi:hypothetical protein
MFFEHTGKRLKKRLEALEKERADDAQSECGDVGEVGSFH